MIVRSHGYTATLEIDFSCIEKYCSMLSYMERHGWKRVGLGAQSKLVQNEYNTMTYFAFAKHFDDIKTMEDEIQDIKDAFNR